MKFFSHLIKKHWFLALLLILLLWLLPKVVNVYAYLLQSLGEFFRKSGEALKVPAAVVEKAIGLVGQVAEALARQPLLSFIVPVLLLTVAPVASAILSAWGLLDFFKRDETINVTVNPKPIESPAPPAALPDLPAVLPEDSFPGYDLKSFFA